MKNLNKEQLQAIKHSISPMLIIAGAGTGKTTVLIERIKYLIENNLAKSSEILALTFTEKATREMEERVDIALPLGYSQMWIYTFHSFCDRILRREALHIGLDPKYKLMTQSETIQFVRDSLFEFDLTYFRPLGNPNKFIEGMLTHFSRLGDEDIAPLDYIQWVKCQMSNVKSQKSKKEAGESGEGETDELAKWQELSSAYAKYKELKIKNGVMDFSDLIGETLKLFRSRKNVLAEYRKQFKYVLVDEFQDTNVAQYELIKLLCPTKQNPNLTLVGDDSQSIYKFRGAAISNILHFTNDYKNAKTYLLNRNYRSGQKILDLSHNLIQFNNPDTLESQLGISKKLKSMVLVDSRKIGGEIDGDVKLIHVNRVENEAEKVVEEIENLIGDPKNTLDYKDFAILVRANNHADVFMKTLERHLLPYQFLGPGKLFKEPEISDLIAYLKVVNDFTDSLSFFKLLSSEFFTISTKDIIILTNISKKSHISLFEVCETVSDLKVSDQTKDKITSIVSLINKHIELSKDHSAGQILYLFLEESGFLTTLLNPDSVDADKKAKNIAKFFDKIRSYEVDHVDALIANVIDWIDLATELGESPLAADTDWTENNAVNILTIHSAKGLEFPVVFMVNLVSQRFPTMERREQIPIPESLIKEILPSGDYHIQEERRLFYVGATRAKERLYLTASDYYGEGKRTKKLSQFIFETLGEKADGHQSAVNSSQLSILNYKSDSTDLISTTNTKEPITKINSLSYSQIETFSICPLHYKLKYIYKLPTPYSSSQSFGNSFHFTMKEFYDEIKAGKKANDDLMDSLLKKNWITEGYLSKSHERGSFTKAQGFLHRYLKENFDSKIQPIAMEIPFSFRLEDLKIAGKIDRIDDRGDTIEIIDYKTGAHALTQKEADKNLQLSIYALAVTQIPEFSSGKTLDKVVLKLMYFDTPQTITTIRTKGQLEGAKEEILEIRKEIESSDFKCSKNMLCENCEYRLFCSSD